MRENDLVGILKLMRSFLSFYLTVFIGSDVVNAFEFLLLNWWYCLYCGLSLLPPALISAAVVTLDSIEIFKTHEWIPTKPKVYFQCKGEREIILPDVKNKHVLYSFRGEESWQVISWWFSSDFNIFLNFLVVSVWLLWFSVCEYWSINKFVLVYFFLCFVVEEEYQYYDILSKIPSKFTNHNNCVPLVLFFYCCLYSQNFESLCS